MLSHPLPPALTRDAVQPVYAETTALASARRGSCWGKL